MAKTCPVRRLKPLQKRAKLEDSNLFISKFTTELQEVVLAEDRHLDPNAIELRVQKFTFTFVGN